MAGTITHEWNGTVLTITSDSGTSSMDLKGEKGDKGCRGAQGAAGIIINDDGTIDMSGYATEEYVDNVVATEINKAIFEGISLDDYALITDIPTNISAFDNDVGYLTEHQSLEDYALKTYVDEKFAETDIECNWDDITDKPFGDGYWEDCYRWDGQWSSLTTFTTKGVNVPRVMCKVSDKAPSASALINNCTIMIYDSDNFLVEEFDVKLGDVVAHSQERWGYIQNSEGEKVVAFFYSNNIYEVEEGLYLLPVTYDKASETIYTYTRFMYYTSFYTKPFEENLIPDTIARVEDVQTMIDTALGVIENGTY